MEAKNKLRSEDLRFS